MKKLLIATDLSARSDRALQRALALAKDFGAELTILHVLDESLPESILARHEEAARAAIDASISSLPLARDISFSTEIIRGRDYSDIIRRAFELPADLMVLGIHRHDTREMFRGTTAERIVRYGTQPVLVVKDAVVASYRRALVPVDLSPHSQAALAAAARLVPKGQVHLVHAAHRPYTAFLGHDTQNQLIRDERARISATLEANIRQLSAELGESAPQFEIVLREGEVRRVIREQVDVLKPDLLALGTHGRTGIAHAVLGSVAEDLLADAPVDVLAVKAAAA